MSLRMILKNMLLVIISFPLFSTSVVTAFVKLNINSLLNSFSDCTLHVNTYEFTWGPGLTSVGAQVSKHFVEDEVPFTEPVIMSKSSTRLREINQNLVEYGVYFKKGLPNISDFSRFHFKAKLHKKPCVAQLFILSDTSTLPPYFEQDVFLAPDVFSVIMIDLVQEDKNSRAPYPLVNIFKYGVYLLLVADDLEKVRETWEMQSKEGKYFSGWVQYANSFNRLAIQYSQKTKEFEEFFVIYMAGKFVKMLNMNSFYSKHCNHV